MTRATDGQALVETVMVLPILLFMVVGILGTGLALRQGLVLQQAAYQSAVAAEQEDCAVVPMRATQLLGRSADTECAVEDEAVVVTLTQPMDFVSRLFPDWSLTIGATGKATIRDEPEPSATP